MEDPLHSRQQQFGEQAGQIGPGTNGFMEIEEDEEIDVDELKGLFLEWLEREPYPSRLNSLKRNAQDSDICGHGGVGLRLLVNINDIRNSYPREAERLVRHPVPFMWAISEAAKELAVRDDAGFKKVMDALGGEIHVGFEGSFGHQLVSPRGLVSSCLKTLVCVEGIVTRVTSVRPKMVQSVQYCHETKKYHRRSYRDATCQELGLKLPGKGRLMAQQSFPTKDDNENVLEMEFGLCTFRDHQVITLQEMPEKAPLGQLPRGVEAILVHDLVNSVKPGDRIQAVGVYRALAKFEGQINGTFGTTVLANNVSILGRDVQKMTFVPQDIQQIREVSKREDILQLLGRSLCPAIYGHEYIKQALILQLLGGEEKNLEHGAHLRGDINILLVGDPSTAKSQLLRSISNVAELAISTSGRGSSGVGLTAAVVSDSQSGEGRRLEAGAMVLADRGTVCIDEFDKMSEIDRVAIHEVMEQQTVTIAKAGIHACLNARCSVLAAANPVYGRYDRERRPQENIGLPDSLLSRLDLLFVVLDQLNPEVDRAICSHVLRGHRYRRPGTDMAPEPLCYTGGGVDDAFDRDDEVQEGQDKHAAMYEKRNLHVYGKSRRHSADKQQDAGAEGDILQQAFLKKFIHFAKERCHPKLVDEAGEFVSTAYAALRAKQDIRTLPVTARSLETVIRLATACAKARLSEEVLECDCRQALDLMMYALYHETDSGVTATEEENNNNPCNGSHGNSQGENGGMGSKRPREEERLNALMQQEDIPLKKRLRTVVLWLFESRLSDQLSLEDVMQALGESVDGREQVEAALNELAEGNDIMYDKGVLYAV